MSRLLVGRLSAIGILIIDLNVIIMGPCGRSFHADWSSHW